MTEKKRQKEQNAQDPCESRPPSTCGEVGDPQGNQVDAPLFDLGRTRVQLFSIQSQRSPDSDLISLPPGRPYTAPDHLSICSWIIFLRRFLRKPQKGVEENCSETDVLHISFPTTAQSPESRPSATRHPRTITADKLQFLDMMAIDSEFDKKVMQQHRFNQIPTTTMAGSSSCLASLDSKSLRAQKWEPECKRGFGRRR